MRSTLRGLLSTFWVFLLLTGCLHRVPEVDPRVASNLAVFDEVWTTVRDTGFAIEHSGVDWENARETWRPRAAEAPDSTALYAILREMLDTLQLSHFSVMAPERATDHTNVPVESAAPLPEAEGLSREEGGSGGTADAGLDVRWLQGQLVVVRSRPGSQVIPGDVLLKVGDFDPLAAADALQKRTDRASEVAILLRSEALAALTGSPGEQCTLMVEAPSGERRTVVVNLEDGLSRPTGFGHLSVNGEVETRTLEGGVGYVRWNVFMMDLLPEISRAIGTYKDAPGLILDLRGNPGGVAGMAQAVAGNVVTRPISLGSMQNPEYTIEFPVQPRSKVFSGPLVVLVDMASASTSEILAAGLQESERATLVGETTAGLVLPSMVIELEDGGLFQYALALYLSPTGEVVEGVGVKPDVQIAPTRVAWASGRDVVLETALAVIRDGTARRAD